MNLDFYNLKQPGEDSKILKDKSGKKNPNLFSTANFKTLDLPKDFYW